MMKILDVINDEPYHTLWSMSGYEFNMMSVINELSGDIDDKISIIKYLMDRDYIAESKYTHFSDLSIIMTDDGSYIDLSKDYLYRIEHGEWSVIHKGHIIDAVYQTHHNL